MASRAINIYSPLTRPRVRGSFPPAALSASLSIPEQRGSNEHHARTAALSRGTVVCSAAAQESSSSSTATVTDDKKEEESVAAATPTATAAAPPKSGAAAAAKPKKAPVKALPQLMEEVIPSLKAILEAEQDLTQIELSFHENRLEGSFLKNDIPYIFWAFFPNGTLIGPKGFSLSSYGSEASTVEPFLIDEKKITARHVVFWVEKRLAAQGIIPVWKEE